ncbi:galactokinase [Malassezia vespertilionis]|uniref:galactokinase n=1 Tax=Malassezia vespertilionis TaxID=2020962 RepID=UPI0024B22976|nr:galactokinase [Malassezia vespertilionis]WFD05743.1 galactokinase [Malassezia vespertilionis]
MHEIVPLLASLDQVYAPPAQERERRRWSALNSRFETLYHQKPSFVARAPGRVNLIGDVIPAAIDKDILMATVFVHDPSASSLHFTLENVSRDFAPASFACNIHDPQSVKLANEGDTRWANYFKVALQGLQPHLPAEAIACGRGVPPASSLSSSAAMTICSSIVILTALGARDQISRKKMTEIAIESERLVGVNSGGMDQAVSVYGVPNHAVYVSFVPSLETRSVPLPFNEDDSFVFVVSNTLVESDKKVMGPVQYNLRVVETRMAARILEMALGLNADQAHFPRAYQHTLYAVADAYFQRPGAWEAALKDSNVRDTRTKHGEKAAQLQWMLRIVDTHIPHHAMVRKEVEEATGLQGAAFDREFLESFPIRADQFHLHSRATHVYSEAQRVILFRTCCDATNVVGKASLDPLAVYAELGALMNASNKSLHMLYDCSCIELQEVVEIARAHGSLGSRLTGAGWGGCAVHLVPRAKLSHVLDGLKKEYYAKRFPLRSDAQVQDALFATEPARGACVFQCS